MSSKKSPKSTAPPRWSPKPVRQKSRKPANITAAAVNAMSEGHQVALRKIRNRIEIAGAVTCVCAAVLRGQASDNDPDVALALRRCVVDELDRQTDSIDRLLGEPPGELDEEAGNV
jgi:hypothetical protein